jgi:hypothetical protein
MTGRRRRRNSAALNGDETSVKEPAVENETHTHAQTERAREGWRGVSDTTPDYALFLVSFSQISLRALPRHITQNKNKQGVSAWMVQGVNTKNEEQGRES